MCDKNKTNNAINELIWTERIYVINIMYQYNKVTQVKQIYVMKEKINMKPVKKLL